MYTTSGHYHGSAGYRFYLQRFLCSYRSLVAILIIFFFTVFLYYYNESLSLLKTREIEGNQCQQKLDSISAQLQVVYEHKSRLEKALTGDRDACTKKMDDMTKNLKTAKDGFDKGQTELKSLQKVQTDLQKQVADLKAAKLSSEKAVSKAGVDAAKANETHAKEIETAKSENTQLNVLVNQLQAALNKSADQMHLLQQQLDWQKQQAAFVQQQQLQQQQQQPPPPPHPGLQQQVNRPAAVVEPVQIPFQQQAALVPPNANGSVQQAPPNGQVPRGNAAFPPPPQTSNVQPQPEQVAIPMAEHQQQQLYAQKQVPLQQQQQQQQQLGQAGAPAPVLQHPLGEGQQQLMMMRPNIDPLAPGVPPVVQAPPPAPFGARGQPLQQQAPPPAPIKQLNNSIAAPPPPAPAAVQDGEGDVGGGAGYHEIESQLHPEHLKAADEYKDDDEETRQKDFDTER